MALLRRDDLSVTEVCFEVGCSSLGTFSSRFTELDITIHQTFPVDQAETSIVQRSSRSRPINRTECATALSATLPAT